MRKKGNPAIRYAVVGQGYFAQAAILPAFQHAENARLVALVSGDPVKLQELGDKYQVPLRCTYPEYDALLASGDIDAVYIALPNDQHCDYTVRAASHGIHVLCEKPMAVSEAECRAMIDACATHSVQLMIGYRLHFEAGNLTAIDLVREGEIGEARIFNSVFSMQVREGNTRLQAARGGGPLNDIGIYCINAARYVYRCEPTETMAYLGTRVGDRRFDEVEESAAVTLCFPDDRLASFVCSYAAADVARYTVVGSEGSLVVDNAYEWTNDIKLQITKQGKTSTRTFPRRDQVAAELVYFSRCIRENVMPEPSGEEGLADVRILEAIRRSAQTGQRVAIEPVDQHMRPDPEQEIRIKPHGEPKLVHVEPPSR
jgi:predicted dehydrogenase